MEHFCLWSSSISGNLIWHHVIYITKNISYSDTIWLISLKVQPAIFPQPSAGGREQNWLCFREGWRIFLPLSIPAKLANHRQLCAHVCGKRRIALSFRCGSQPWETAWAAVWTDKAGWLHVTWRKCIFDSAVATWLGNWEGKKKSELFVRLRFIGLLWNEHG